MPDDETPGGALNDAPIRYAPITEHPVTLMLERRDGTELGVVGELDRNRMNECLDAATWLFDRGYLVRLRYKGY